MKCVDWTRHPHFSPSGSEYYPNFPGRKMEVVICHVSFCTEMGTGLQLVLGFFSTSFLSGCTTWHPVLFIMGRPPNMPFCWYTLRGLSNTRCLDHEPWGEHKWTATSQRMTLWKLLFLASQCAIMTPRMLSNYKYIPPVFKPLLIQNKAAKNWA